MLSASNISSSLRFGALAEETTLLHLTAGPDWTLPFVHTGFLRLDLLLQEGGFCCRLQCLGPLPGHASNITSGFARMAKAISGIEV